MHTETDILIVGAGPAGSTLARMLAEKGREVTLIDKEAFPRIKPCGGGLPYRTLAEFGIELDGVDFASVDNVLLKGLTREPLHIIPENPAIVVNRKEFDHHLVKLAIDAGARFYQNAELKEIFPDGSNWIAHTKSNEVPTMRSKIICACDGARSKTARMFGCGISSCGLAVSGWANISESAGLDARNTAVFNLGCGRGGYGWFFPHKNVMNVGLGYSFWKVPDIKKRLIDLCKKEAFICSDEPCVVRGGALPWFEGPRLWYAKQNFYAVGDAAGLVDPLTGEGIYYAMKSAKYAADAIINSNEAAYTKNVRDNIANELDVARHFAHRWRWVPLLMLKVLMGRRRMRSYADLFALQYSGKITYRELYDRMHGLID